MSSDALPDARPDTLVAHAGLKPEANHGIVNPPVYHASTVLFSSVAELEARSRTPYQGVFYGRHGTPTSFALEEAVAELEGGYRAITASSGLAALTTALLAVTRAGDHVLVVDCVYAPTRFFCDNVLRRNGVEVEYFDPALGAGIAALIRPTTAAIFLEAPGSLTFEMQDVPAIAAAARTAAGSRPIAVLIDNTWATPLGFQPLRHGADISIHAATKYIVGHSDAMLGLIVCTEARYLEVKRTAALLGVCAGPDDVYLGLRGLRTLAVRLRRHQETGLMLADWLSRQPEVKRILHPARPDDPGHALWRRDFTAACGLFAFVLHPVPRPALAAMLDGMALFRLGYSWGGFESLSLPSDPTALRTATRWDEPGPLVRLHAGLEDPADLVNDLAAGFARLRAAVGAQ